ncbi:MAG: amidase [bacterium]|nr:amidase [bacterium]
MDDLLTLTLTEAADAVRSGRTTSRALVEACLARTDATDGLVGSFASLQAEAAQQAARELDAGEPVGPLHGVPVALKDLFYTAGVATEANCRSLEGFKPDRDASVVSRLKAAGAVIIGKTNTHELALGVSCPASRNPWNTDRMTGGSSGGNAAGLAARQFFGALGSDTGGSVRIPSNYCGTTAIKTTRGVVPRDGVHLISWTYDTVGPMARTAADCRLLLDVIAGFSPADPFSSKAQLDQPAAPQALRLGVPDESFFDGFRTDPEVRAVMEEAIDVIGSLVADVRTVHLPNCAEHFDLGATVVFAESAALLEELRSTRGDLLGDEVRSILEGGAAVPGIALAAAQAGRVAFERSYLDVFEEQAVDIVIAPINPNQPLPHGSSDIDGVPLIPATAQFTFPVNGAGVPAVALPGGFAADGLPIGFQLIGPPLAEHTLAALGEAFQAETDHHDAVPDLAL